MKYLTIVLTTMAFLATPLMVSPSYATCSGRPTCPKVKTKSKKVVMKCKRGKVFSARKKKCVKRK